VDTKDRISDLEEQVRRLEARRAELEAQIASTRYAEVLLRSILDTVPDFVLKFSPDGIIHFCNRIAPGLGVADVAGESIYAFMAPESVETARAAIERVMQSGQPDSYESVGQGAYGKPAQYLTRLAPLKRGGEVESMVMVATDVTALSDSLEKLDVAVSASGVGLWSWHRDSDQVVWDVSTCAIFGVEKAPTSFRGYLELIHPGDRERVEASVSRSMETRQFEAMEHRLVHPSGEVRWVICKGRVELDAGGQVTRMLGGVLDVTERHRLQEQLLQAQKMEAVGQLASGIAHNFNNMLTVMLAAMELASKKAGGEAAVLLEEGQQSALRAAQMVRQLMVFSGKSRDTSWRQENLGSVVQRTLEISRTTFGDELSLSVSIAPDLPLVRCDGGQIEQALLNVLINARDSLAEIEGRNPEIRVTVEAPGGRELHIVIADNGGGMSEDVRRRVFEPFFTTKEPGRGTGLGLATTYAILREHGGRIECQSTLGVGTRFHLYLPAEAETRTGQSADLAPSRKSGGGERVLVVDDEPMIRDLMTRMLGSAGYVVDTAVDGIDAIDRVRENAGCYQVVLLDQSMPRLAGRAALRALRGIDASLKIICFSGFPASLEGADAVLEKPVPEQRLLETIEAVLRK